MGLYRQDGSENWWMSFTAGGRRYRKSTGTDDKKLAGLILADIELKILKQEKLGIEPELEYTFDDMMAKFMDEYAPKKGRKHPGTVRAVAQAPGALLQGNETLGDRTQAHR